MDKKLTLLALLFVFFTSCGEDDGTDCSLVDCALQSFSIEIVDIDGNNLIANGTYDKSNIIVTKNDNQLNSNLSTSDEIYFEIRGEVGNNTYLIKLNDSETDILVLNLTTNNQGNECCSPFYTINSALYNNTTIEIDRRNTDFIYDDRIVIVKQ